MPPVWRRRVRGTVESLDGTVLTVKSRDGQGVKVALAPDWRAVEVLPATADAIKPGVFIGTAAHLRRTRRGGAASNERLPEQPA